jgi:hypothetical protein
MALMDASQIITEIKQKIGTFAEYISLITKLPPDEFDNGFHEWLECINEMSLMEWCGDWFLIHRTEPEMVLLCEQAGIPRENICFDQKPLDMSIFCKAEKDAKHAA